MPYSEEEFQVKQYSGDYETLSKSYKPGELVTEITKGPILKPARLLRVGLDDTADITYSIFDEKSGEVKAKMIKVDYSTIKANQLAGPNFFIDQVIQIPNSIENAEYDLNLICQIDAHDLESLLDAIELKANSQYLAKLKTFRKYPNRPEVKNDFGNSEYITGDLLVTIVSARNLSTKHGDGEVYVEIKTYERNYEEEQFGNFALDESFQKGKESQQKMTQVVNTTSAFPIDKNVVFNEEKNMG
jgi:hypothetical protein